MIPTHLRSPKTCLHRHQSWLRVQTDQVYMKKFRSLSPYLKSAVLKEHTPGETNRKKREPNVRKPMLFKRQANGRKPILLLNDPMPSDQPAVKPTDQTEIVLQTRSESLSRSIAFPEEDNKVEDDLTLRSDRARRPILVKP